MGENENKLPPKIKEILEWSYCVIVGVGLAIIVRYYIGTPTIVKQPSMYPTLKQDQRLLLNRWDKTTHKTPERGDIVTFEAPSTFTAAYDADLDNPVALYENNPEGWWNKFLYYVLELNKTSYIKRVIGLPGDHVKIENNKVYINDEELDEPYLAEGVITDTTRGVYKDVIVPEGTVFVMGDNRGQSADSRRFGCIPIERIESKVLIRFWPLDTFGKVD